MEQAPQQDQVRESIFSKALKTAAYPVAAVLGLWTAKVNVSDAAYDNVKKLDGLSGIEDSGLDELKEAFRKGLQPGADNKGLPDFVAENRKTYFHEIEGRKTKLNIKGLFNEWKVIHRSQKQSAIINGITVAAVSLGAMLAMANMKAIHHALFHDDKDKPSEPQR